MALIIVIVQAGEVAGEVAADGAMQCGAMRDFGSGGATIRLIVKQSCSLTGNDSSAAAAAAAADVCLHRLLSRVVGSATRQWID
jgi:hypothetical protein